MKKKDYTINNFISTLKGFLIYIDFYVRGAEFILCQSYCLKISYCYQ